MVTAGVAFGLVDATPRAGNPVTMPDPGTVIKRSLTMLSMQGFTPESSRTIIATSIASARTILRTVYPGPLPWFAALEDELIRQAGVPSTLIADLEDGSNEHPDASQPAGPQHPATQAARPGRRQTP